MATKVTIRKPASATKYLTLRKQLVRIPLVSATGLEPVLDGEKKNPLVYHTLPSVKDLLELG